MIFKKTQKFLIVSLILAGMGITLVSFAKDSPAPVTKTYTLTNLRRVVSNSDQCAPFFKDLKQLAKNPIQLLVTKNVKKGTHELTDASGMLQKHTSSIIKQNVKNGVVNRLDMGSFEFKKQQIDYVVAISANINHPNHQYLYPIIFASHNAQCYYTALVQPSKATIEAFKKNIKSGAVAKETDLDKK